ncbi:hypothetical protein D3C77_722540 [compost metagenome]
MLQQIVRILRRAVLRKIAGRGRQNHLHRIQWPRHQPAVGIDPAADADVKSFAHQIDHAGIQ